MKPSILEQIVMRYPDEQFLKADGFDAAVIGFDCSMNLFRLIYSYTKCIKILVKRDRMSWEEAEEFFDFNVAGSYMGEKTPIWCVDDFE
jgi:hypothetical protein